MAKDISLARSWPEERLRLRRLVPLAEALQLMDDVEMARAVKRMAAELKKKH